MNRPNLVERLRTIAVTITATMTLGASSAALAVPLPPLAFPLCGGSIGFVASAGPYVDINGVPGLETIVPHRSAIIELDGDFDLLAPATVNYIVNYHDESGALSGGTALGQSNVLSIRSNEVFQALAGLDILTVATTFTVPLQMASFYTVGFACESIGIAESGGNSYIVLAAGASAAEGTPEAGTDLTKIRVWVLDPANLKAMPVTHTIAGFPGQFFLPQASGIMDVDGDGDDELLVVRSEWRAPVGNKERVLIHSKSVSLLNPNTTESTTTVNYSISMDNQNNP